MKLNTPRRFLQARNSRRNAPQSTQALPSPPSAFPLMPGKPIPRVRSCIRPQNNATHQQRRAFATKVVKGDALVPTTQDAHRSFRVRKDGSKLPLSPILDPVVTAQKSHWTQTKVKPDVSTSTPFQKKLWQTPYAHTLASPIRLDRSTSTLLPSDLLLTLHLKPHPETQAPWLLPLSLSSSTPAKYKGPPIRIVAHKHTVAYLSKKKDGWRRAALTQRHITLLGPKNIAQLVWREDMAELLQTLLQKRVVDKLSWFFRWRGRLVGVASPRAEDLEGVEDVSSVLLYGSLKTRANAVQDEASEVVAEADKWSMYFRSGFGSHYDPHKKHSEGGAADPAYHPPFWYEPIVPRLAARARYPPLEFPTATWRGRKVALYSLTDMLGEDRAKELIAGAEETVGKGRCWVLKRGRQNVPVELLLMQLQSYLAEPWPVWQTER